MLARALMQKYVSERPGLEYQIEYIGPHAAGDKVADLVLLVRVSDEAVREWGSRGYVEAFGGTVIGHNSFAVVVDPQCPLRELSLADMKAVLSGEVQSWEHFGLPVRPLSAFCDSWAAREIRHFLKARSPSVRRVTYPEKLALAVAGNPDAIGFIATRPWLPNTGLRMVRITCESVQDSAVRPDRLSILHHPQATPQVRDLAAFLWENLAKGSMTDVGAWAKTCGLRPQEVIWPKPGGAGPSELAVGTVACLPIQSRLHYFLTLTPDFVKDYEVQLEQALTSSAGLEIVDRHQLRQILAEWRLAFISGDDGTRSRKMLAADVLVEPTLVDDAQHAYLSLKAIHVQTGSVLGHMKLAIDPDRAGRFGLDLGKRVAAWWPGVRGNLRRVRALPIVSVRATGQGPGAARRVQRLRHELQEALAGQGHCYAAPYESTPNAQTEMLLRAMGLAAPSAAYRSVAFDYVLEAQLLSHRRAELRIVAPAVGKETAHDTIEATSFESLMTSARAWAVLHGGTLARLSDRPLFSSGSDDWFAQQAMREFQAAENSFPGIVSAVPALPKDSPERLTLASDMLQRYLGAYHLDPTNEKIAFRLLELAGYYGDRDLAEAPVLLEAAGRYILTFPNASRDLTCHSTTMYRGLVLHYSGGAGNGFRHVGFPEWMEKSQRQVPDLEARLQAYRVLADWLIRATRNIPDAEMFRFPRYWMDHYLVASVEYLRLTKASDEQVAQVVASWARRYDAYPQVVPPSEFLLLGVMVAKGDKRGALEQFSKMIQRRPDPADKFWTFFGRDTVSDILAHVDQKLRDEARRWLTGKVQTGELRELVRKRLSTPMPGE